MGQHQGRAAAMALSSDGKTAVSGGIDQTIRIWDIASGKQKMMLIGHGQGVYGIAISPDGRLAVSGSGDGALKIWDIVSGKDVRTLSGHNRTIYDVAISPDGKCIASASLNGTAKLCSLSSGELLVTFREDTGSPFGVPLYSVAFAGNAQILTDARDGSIRLRNADSGKLVRLYPPARGGGR